MSGELTVYWTDKMWGLKKEGGLEYDDMIDALENALLALKKEREELK